MDAGNVLQHVNREGELSGKWEMSGGNAQGGMFGSRRQPLRRQRPFSSGAVDLFMPVRQADWSRTKDAVNRFQCGEHYSFNSDNMSSECFSDKSCLSASHTDNAGTPALESAHRHAIFI